MKKFLIQNKDFSSYLFVAYPPQKEKEWKLSLLPVWKYALRSDSKEDGEDVEISIYVDAVRKQLLMNADLFELYSKAIMDGFLLKNLTDDSGADDDLKKLEGITLYRINDGEIKGYLCVVYPQDLKNSLKIEELSSRHFSVEKKYANRNLKYNVKLRIDESKRRVFVREDFFNSYSILFTKMWDAKRIREA